jgi:two-component sensor histidine kinase
MRCAQSAARAQLPLIHTEILLTSLREPLTVPAAQTRQARGKMPARLFNHSLPPQRIRTFLILFALALTLPLVGIGIFALNRMAGLEQGETERRVMQVAQDIADDIDRELDRATVVLETLATSAALKDRDFRAFHMQAALALKRTKAAIVLIDPAYRQIIDTLKEFGSELPPTADPETAKRVFATKQRQVSDLFRGSVSGRPVFNVEVPVLEGDTVPYVLIMSFQAAHVADLLQSVRLEPPWITGVTDNKGIILARSERHEDFVGRPLPAELLAQSRAAQGVFRGTSVAGERILRATVRSQIAGWLVSATVPVWYADAPRKRSQLFATAMVATALALGAALALIFGSFMARPLSAATSAAEALGKSQPVEPLRSPLAEANILTSTLSAASLELHRRQAHAEFLMRELAHRAKNQLAVVKGMALQTAKQSGSVEDFVARFNQRLEGLAQSQELMLRQNWQGAWIADLVRAHLELFGARERAGIAGPPIFLAASAVQNLGYALHELATNASKHGALSAPGGRVEIVWSGSATDQQIRLQWTELDGPSVHSPLRHGFGHLVLTRLVAQALEGTSKLEFCSDGVRWELQFPASHALEVPIPAEVRGC